MNSFQVIFVLYSLALLARSCQSFLPPLPISKNKLMKQSLQATTGTNQQGSRKSSQLIEFQEPTTGVTVKLVGCMHYNPASIQLTQDTINELGKRKKLGAVVIESCDIRWSKTNELPRAVQALLTSEMKAATELAMKTYKRPVVLGDQRINITVKSLGQGLQETAIDLLTPWNGGWNRFLSNVTTAKEQALPSSSAGNDDLYLNAFAFLDPKLLLAAPVSLIKYPLSYLFRSPLPTLAFFTLVFLSEQPADAATNMWGTGGGTGGVNELTLVDWVESLAFSAAEIALFSRIFLKELLVDRNKLLARNILEQCRLYQSGGAAAGTKQPSSNSRIKMAWWNNLFTTRNTNDNQEDKEEPFQVVYVKGAEPAQKGTSTTTSSLDALDDEPMAVVAILGMAHCNGIAKLLKEQLV